jgi:anti-sigma factor RsiW
MPELHPSEEEAALYLLGELSDAESAAFEERLGQSAELRTLVCELEEGVAALAISCPRHLPRPQTWQRIERAVRRESRRVVVPVFLGGWWRNGWAAAAACLIGWMLYAFWTNRSSLSGERFAGRVDRQAPGGATVDPVVTGMEQSKPRTPPSSASQREELLETRLRENAALRWRVRDLENQATQLSQSLTQHQALLSERGRLKFLQLPSPNHGEATVPQRISPDLQRALFLAMARELGWLTSADPDASTSRLGVTFVDLRPGTNRVTNPPEIQRIDTGIATAIANPQGPSNGSTVGGTIPAFVSGDSMTVAVDSSMAPSGSTVTFWTGPAGQDQQAIGTIVMSDNPAAVTIPFASASANGWSVTVTSTSAGGSNVIGQLFTSGTHP